MGLTCSLLVCLDLFIVCLDLFKGCLDLFVVCLDWFVVCLNGILSLSARTASSARLDWFVVCLDLFVQCARVLGKVSQVSSQAGVMSLILLAVRGASHLLSCPM